MPFFSLNVQLIRSGESQDSASPVAGVSRKPRSVPTSASKTALLTCSSKPATARCPSRFDGLEKCPTFSVPPDPPAGFEAGAAWVGAAAAGAAGLAASADLAAGAVVAAAAAGAVVGAAAAGFAASVGF